MPALVVREEDSRQNRGMEFATNVRRARLATQVHRYALNVPQEHSTTSLAKMPALIVRAGKYRQNRGIKIATSVPRACLAIQVHRSALLVP